MYKKKSIDREAIMNMSPNACHAILQAQQEEIVRLTNLVERQGKKCHKYQKMLAAARFGDENKISSKKSGPGTSRHTFAGSKEHGYYSWFENGELVIEHHSPREGGEIYRGEYKGEQTPYLDEIRRNNVKMYNSIIKFFADRN